MLPAFSVKHDLERLSRNFGLMPKERMAAAVRSLNRAITTARKEGTTSLRKEYPGLKAAMVRKRIRLQRASRSKAAASITFSASRLRLQNWAVRQTARGIVGRKPKKVLRIDARTGRATDVSAAELRSGFIQRGTRGGANVWLRQGKKRHPIDVLVTPSLSETVVEERLNELLRRRAAQRFVVVFQQEAKFRLSKRT